MVQPDSEKENKSEINDTADIEELKKALAEEKTRSEANLAGWQRAQADFINYKRRAEQEKEDALKYANSDLIMKLLPVLDDFELAFTAIPAKEADAGWVQGIKVVERKLKNILESIGISELKAAGQPFDPSIHEAVMQDEGEEGIVIKEFQKGYKLGDRVIRPSKVSVGRGVPVKDKEES